MTHRSVLQASLLLMFACGAVAANKPKVHPHLDPHPQPLPQFSVLSVNGNILKCKKGTSECRITVRVEVDQSGKCLAIIDPAQIRIRKNTPVKFILARSTITDTNTYTFKGPNGITWNSAPPTTDQLKFDGFDATQTVAMWTAGKTATKGALAFTPEVVRVSDGAGCAAGDPVIANDG